LEIYKLLKIKGEIIVLIKNYSKRLLSVSFLSAVLLLPVSTTFASEPVQNKPETTTLDFSSKELQEELKRAEENTKKAKENLEIDKKALEKELEELKKYNPEKYELINQEIEAKESTNGMVTMSSTSKMGTKGDVLVTYDQAIKDWNHGHAAIVAIDNNYIYEAMPDSGVRYYPNRWGNYNTKKAMWVSGATSSHYSNAVAFAADQLGEPYSLAAAKDQTLKWYCSLLVWKAWNRQGFDLDGNGGLVVTPADLENDSQTLVY
jgi:uncharacterized protein YycO